MKLLFCLFNYFPYGGLQRECLALATACQQRGHTVEILTSSWQGDEPFGITVTVLPAQATFHHTRAEKIIAQFQQYFSSHFYDLIIGFNRIAGIDIYFAADPCYYAKFAQLPWYEKILPRHRAYLHQEKALCTQSYNHYLLVTQQEVEKFSHYYAIPQHRLHLLPLGLDTIQYPLDDTQYQQQDLKQRYGLNNTDKLVIFAGSAFKTKGLDRALRAIASLPTSIQQSLHFWIAGNGDAREYQTLIKKLALTAQVKFLGGRDDIAQLFSAADLLLHPARQENAGNVLLEAMGCGLPILTTDICGYAQFVNQAHAGVVLASPFNQTALNQALAQLLNSDLYPMRKAGMAFCKAQHVHERMPKLVDLVEQIGESLSVDKI